MRPLSIAVIGLGQMGAPMAAHLLETGNSVRVLKGRGQAAELVSLGGFGADSPAEACAEASHVILSLPDEKSVRDVLFGARGIVSGDYAHLTVIDTTTLSPEAAIAIGSALARRGIEYLESPVSGGPRAAASGALTAMVAGGPSAIESARVALDQIAERVYVLGYPGHAQTVKACNNLVLSACMMANAEALALATSYGLEMDLVREVILASSGANWQLEHIVPQTIMRGQYSPLFATGHLLKDLGIASVAAQNVGLEAPLVAFARHRYQESSRAFGAGSDFSSIYRLYSQQAENTSQD